MKYDKIKAQLDKATNQKAVNDLLETAVKSRNELKEIINDATRNLDELSSIIELCVEKQSELHPKPQYDC